MCRGRTGPVLPHIWTSCWIQTRSVSKLCFSASTVQSKSSAAVFSPPHRSSGPVRAPPVGPGVQHSPTRGTGSTPHRGPAGPGPLCGVEAMHPTPQHNVCCWLESELCSHLQMMSFFCFMSSEAAATSADGLLHMILWSGLLRSVTREGHSIKFQMKYKVCL